MVAFGKKDITENDISLQGACNCGAICASMCKCKCKSWRTRGGNRCYKSNGHWSSFRVREPGPSFPND
jgi:hypothetical protein